MSDRKKFKDESQDARRRDQNNETHPFEKIKSPDKDKKKYSDEKK